MCGTLWRFRVQKSRPMEIHTSFFFKPQNATYLIEPWNLQMLFSHYPLEIPRRQPTHV